MADIPEGPLGAKSGNIGNRWNGVAREHRYYQAMLQIVLKLKNPFSSWMIYPFACALAVIGAKCWMIDRYGSPTPFWDQWDAEGAVLYPRFLSGTLHFSDLIGPHAEHRILATRLWSLLLLGIEGYWDPTLQMLANTLILGAIVVLFVAVLRPILDHTSWIVFVLFSLVIFSLPFGWENTLWGFSSQYYCCCSVLPAWPPSSTLRPLRRVGGWRRCCSSPVIFAWPGVR